MKGEEAVELFKLAKANNLLPDKLSDLVPLSFIGQAAIAFYRAKIKVMDQLKMTEEQRRVTLRDGQDAGEMLLDIETRIGELLPPREVAIKGTSPLGKRYQRPEGITEKRAHHARAIAENPKVVERVKKQARENEDIPTKTAVINQIRYESEKRRNAEAKSKMGELKGIVAIEQIQYINVLDRVIGILPQKPPEKWEDSSFKQAKSKAQIIIKRLEVFNGR